MNHTSVPVLARSTRTQGMPRGALDCAKVLTQQACSRIGHQLGPGRIKPALSLGTRPMRAMALLGMIAAKLRDFRELLEPAMQGGAQPSERQVVRDEGSQKRRAAQHILCG